MGDPQPSQSSLREPLLDPDIVENSSYWIMCQRRSEASLGLEDVLRSWYDQQEPEVSGNGDNDTHDDGTGDNHDNNASLDGLHRSERSCRKWYRNPLQIMAMISNFSTSFNVVNISLVLPILKVVLKEIHPFSAQVESMLASSLLGGMVAGQIIGGALGDSFLGLAGALTLVMLLQLVASLGSAFVSVHVHDFYYHLAAWRFVLGIGAGAVYPLAACLSVEQGASSSCKDHEALRTKRVVWTFAMQGIGFWVVPALACALVYGRMQLHLVWRVLLGTGCVPGVVLLYMQYRVLIYQPSTANSAVSPVTADDGDQEPATAAEEPAATNNDTEVQSTPYPAIVTNTENENVEKSADSPASTVPSGEPSLSAGPSTEPTRSFTPPPSPPPPEVPAIPSQAALEQRQVSVRSEQDRQREQDNTGMADRELHDDSDGEVGTFLDSSPDMDMSSAGIFRESEPPAISTGWWISLQTEERLCQKLLGTAATWFLFDVLFYGNTLFQPIVIEQAFGSRRHLESEALIRRVVTDSLILNSISLPGYFVAALLIGKKTLGIKQSPRYVMMQGFTAMALLYFAIALSWHPLGNYPILLVFLYGMTFFFANYGPNTTTFILPSLVYSAECRSTFNGLSAACGKLGAIVGATMFAPLSKMFHEEAVMFMCAFTSLVALVMTVFFVRLKESPALNPRPGHGRYSVVDERAVGEEMA